MRGFAFLEVWDYYSSVNNRKDAMEYDSQYWRLAAIEAQQEAARCARIALEYLVNENGQRSRILARAWQFQSASASGIVRARMELAS